MDVSNMISILQITQNLVERNRSIDQTSDAFRDFKRGMEHMIAHLETLLPPAAPRGAMPSILPTDNAPKP